MKKGVFWIIDGNLHSFPFDGTLTDGIAKSGDTYNHKKLWEFIKPKGCNKPYNYYPRGRVDISNEGNAVLYMSPHIKNTYIAMILLDFNITTDCIVRYDHSDHYKCCLDE